MGKIHVDTSIGQDHDEPIIEHKRNADGTYYYRASATVTHLFGSEMGENAPTVEGFGVTEDQAKRRLSEALRSCGYDFEG